MVDGQYSLDTGNISATYTCSTLFFSVSQGVQILKQKEGAPRRGEEVVQER